MVIRAGDIVEIESLENIVATLDERGTLDGLPFMPEMAAFCGKRFVVAKVAHKTCDTINASGGRRLLDALHLEGLRCDGAGHDGCQAACTLFWKTAWVRKVQDGQLGRAADPQVAAPRAATGNATDLHRHSRKLAPNGQVQYTCQATELLNATKPLAWWEPTQYARDILSGNVSLGVAARTLLLAGLRMWIRTGVGYRAAVSIHDRLARMTGGRRYVLPSGPFVNTRTPTSDLTVKTGDWVRVRPYEEIVQTLDGMGRNRGLTFDAEMEPYCGSTHRVRAIVDKIIDEKTGHMIQMKGACVMLDGAVCRSEYIRGRLFCPRAIAAYWRPLWLERVANREQPGSSDELPSEPPTTTIDRVSRHP